MLMFLLIEKIMPCKGQPRLSQGAKGQHMIEVGYALE